MRPETDEENKAIEIELIMRRPKHHEPQQPLKMFLMSVNPINTEEWSKMRIFAKAYEIFKVFVVQIAQAVSFMLALASIKSIVQTNQ